MAREHRARDCGSAPAEFALVGGLLVLVFLAVVQLAVAVHVRDTLVASAAEGARVGAQAGQTPAAAAARTRELVSASLTPAYARQVSARRVRIGGVDLVEVEVRAPLPVVGLVGAGEAALDVTAHALVEPP
jgi:hypothetical protein